MVCIGLLEPRGGVSTFWTKRIIDSSDLRAYEHTTADQHRAVSQVLESANATFTAEDSLMPVHKQEQPCQSNRENVRPAPVFSGPVQNCVFTVISCWVFSNMNLLLSCPVIL